MRRVIATLWQTRMLRGVRLNVRDEIENALAYFNYTFIEAIPALACDVENAIAGAAGRGRAARACPPRCRSAAGWAAIATATPFVTGRHARGRVPAARPRSPSTTYPGEVPRPRVPSCRSRACSRA
jgi:phosphoenolpyruvate carboxylase